MAVSLAPQLHKDPGMQCRRRSHSPKRCRDLGSLLLSILCIKWQDHVSNEEVLKRASLPSIESLLLQVRLRWAGHASRIEDTNMPKAVFFSELQEGKRYRGTPRKCYEDQLKRQLAQVKFWTLTAELQRRIQAMEMRCYRKILHISYKDHVTNEEVLIQQAIGPPEDLLTIVKRRKLQWYCHVSCSSGLAKTILQAQ